jgi:GAF domain-containing protein
MTHPAEHSSALHHLIAGELRLLELLATEASLPTLLEAFVHSFESSFPEAVCAAMLLNVEGTHLQLAAAPSLPMAYRQAVDGLAVGARMGSCGTAAFTRQTTLVSDISVDPLWQDHPTLALAHGLRACWSTPILSAKGRLLGTFANYYAQQRTPEPHELAVLKRGAHLLDLLLTTTSYPMNWSASRRPFARAKRAT